jgi:hypothetical protein
VHAVPCAYVPYAVVKYVGRGDVYTPAAVAYILLRYG